MAGEQLRALFLFYVSPRKAASAVLDHGRLLFAIMAAVVVSLAISTAAGAYESLEYRLLNQPGDEALLRAAQRAEDPQAALQVLVAMRQQAAQQVRSRYFATGLKILLVLAAVFVPFCVLILAAWDHLGGGMTVLFRDYMPALAGMLFAWTAAHLPLAVVWWSPLVSPPLVVPLQVAGMVAFLILAAPVLATVTGGTAPHAAVTVWVGAAASAGASVLFAHSAGALYMLASPWVLFYLYRMFSADMASIGTGLSSRQNFKRQLEAATINPHDADAHYQLGLIYVQRRLPAEAEARFRRALEIDPNEPDVLFQLGRLLRQQGGRDEEARQLLEKGAQINPKLSSHEVWRELGAVALQSGDTAEAIRYLTHYVSLREYDPEGLVFYGQALQASGRATEAKTAYQQAIDSVQAAPGFRRRELARWESQARQLLRSL